MTTRNNAFWNCKNPYQGDKKKVLTVCSAGLLRSPTIAYYLTREYGFNCRSCGIHDYALVELDEVLLHWADVIIVSDEEKKDFILNKFKVDKPIYNLEIPDQYGFADEDLLAIIEDKVKDIFK